MSNLKFRISVISARDLAAADKTGYSDPYTVVRIDNKKYTTDVIKQNLNPVWDFDVDITINPDKVPSLVNVTVWDKDTFGRDFLGEVNIPFKNVFDRNAGGLSDGVPLHYNDRSNKAQWFTLGKRSEKNVVSGEIQMRFGFVEDHVRDPKQYAEAWTTLTGWS